MIGPYIALAKIEAQHQSRLDAVEGVNSQTSVALIDACDLLLSLGAPVERELGWHGLANVDLNAIHRQMKSDFVADANLDLERLAELGNAMNKVFTHLSMKRPKQ